MELIVLGTGGTWPNAGGATAGFLVRHEGFNLWLDAGSGTLSRLLEFINMGDIHAVAVSHEHPDHFVDLYSCFYARFYGEEGENGLPLYAPTGMYDKVASILSIDSQAVMSVAFDVRETRPGDAFEVGPFRVQTGLMAHLGLSALGFRIQADGAVLAYSGDSGPTPVLVDLARDADLFLCEATWQDRTDLQPFHLSARQAGEHAAESGAERLMLTHLWPSLEPGLSLEQAGQAFDGEILLAVEGERLKVGE